jgi:thymidylate kinase
MFLSVLKMRELVLSPDSGLSGQAMELIFSAMRYENDRWLTNLEAQTDAPDLVVSDRGWLSHLAYTDHNVSKDFTTKLYKGLLASETKLPQVIIYFKVSTETALKRRTSRGTSDVIEAKGTPFQELVRESFETHKNTYRNQIAIYEVDANDTIEGVRVQLDSILDTVLHLHQVA